VTSFPHVALLGDSIFDNAAYTSGQPDVVSHLRTMLPAGWSATLYAVDGAMTQDIARQVSRVSSETTHVVVSIGGNDALQNVDILERRVSSTAEALELFGDRARRFEKSYRDALGRVLSLGRPTTTCTIYNGDLEGGLAPLARVALMLFNDAILRVAFERGLAVIDLRLVCTERSDYFAQIEPSGAGGRKVAAAIARALDVRETEKPPSRVFAV
jgi:hypothetical protein